MAASTMKAHQHAQRNGDTDKQRVAQSEEEEAALRTTRITPEKMLFSKLSSWPRT
jgi:hypothetical protein